MATQIIRIKSIRHKLSNEKRAHVVEMRFEFCSRRSIYHHSDLALIDNVQSSGTSQFVMHFPSFEDQDHHLPPKDPAINHLLYVESFQDLREYLALPREKGT